jgi:hypothetical protein
MPSAFPLKPFTFHVSRTTGVPTVSFRTLLEPSAPIAEFLLNFCLTQFLFFYSLPPYEEGPHRSTGSTPQGEWAWVGAKNESE